MSPCGADGGTGLCVLKLVLLMGVIGPYSCLELLLDYIKGGCGASFPALLFS